MGESVLHSGDVNTFPRSNTNLSTWITRKALVSTSSRTSKWTTILSQWPFRNRMFGRKIAHAALFLVEVAMLEMVRRFSMAKCPFMWRGLQALQVLCYPPFRWIESLALFKNLVRGMQMLSRPLLVLSIATAFEAKLDANKEKIDILGEHDSSDSSLHPPEDAELQPEVVFRSFDEISCNGEDTTAMAVPEDFILRLQPELRNKQMVLPPRIDKCELGGFYVAANRSFEHFLASIINTINWREAYEFIPNHELETWSSFIFWHGHDVDRRRYCLIVRLGLACKALPHNDRSRFAQVIVSQVEHGIRNLVDPNNPQIAVIVDCEGLPLFNIPVAVIRSCCTLLQIHFPNRLASLHVIQLPPVLRFLAQTLIQVLRPKTQQKLRILGDSYRNEISVYFRNLPEYLGGSCTCTTCSEAERSRARRASPERADLESSPATFEDPMGNHHQTLKALLVSFLVLFLFTALVSGIYDALV